MAYAADTKVTPERSRAEIEATLKRYGADAFGFGQDGARAVVTFRLAGRMMRLDVAVPQREDYRRDRYGNGRSPAQAEQSRAKAERQLWRALGLIIKAKCEAVESGIETVEQAWMPYVLLPDNTTVGEFLSPQIAAAYETGTMPSLLPGVPQLTGGTR